MRRANLSNEFQKIGIRISFNVEFNVGEAFENVNEFLNVRSSNVSLVGTRMHSNTVGSGRDALLRSTDNAGDTVVPRIT